MKKEIVALLLVLIIVGIGIFAFARMYPNSTLIPYIPKGPSIQTDTNKNSFGNVDRQLDQANDMRRKSIISDLDLALKKYYAAYKKSPASLDVLVTEKFIKSVKLDPVTNNPPKYSSKEDIDGCKAELILSDGSAISALCK